MRDCRDSLVQKVTRGPKEKMVPQERLVCQEVKDLKDQRVEVVSQDLQAPLDHQE